MQSLAVKDYTDIGERVFYKKLDNGLSIYIVPKNGYFKKRAFLAVNYGGADRKFKIGEQWIDTPSGVAHFLEHKMFDLEDGNALNMFYANGASANAFTSSDMTAYYFECTDNFNENLRLLLRFVSTPYFTEESVAKEQGIIGQEIKMVEDEPNYAVYYNLLRLLYKEHPMRDPVAGTVEEIAQITPQILYDCHRIFYNCINMALVVVGNVNTDDVVKAASDIMPKVRGEMPESDYGKIEGEYPNGHKSVTEMDVGMPIFLAGAKIKQKNKSELLKQEMTANLALRIIMGPSSKLYNELYGKGLVNQSFSAECEFVAGQMMIAFGGESKDPEAVLSEIIQQAEKMSLQDNSALFERQKKAFLGEKLRELNSFSDICYNVAKGCFNEFEPFDAVKTIERITLQDAEQFITDNLSKDKLAISVVKQKQ